MIEKDLMDVKHFGQMLRILADEAVSASVVLAKKSWGQ